MRHRIFLKLFTLVIVVVGVSTVAFDLLVRRNWQASLASELLAASGVSLLAGFIVALVGARGVARRLRKMASFAEEIAAGNLSAHLLESGGDEIASLATTLDKATRQLEINFRNLENSRQQLETLLNSMEDAVVAVSPKREVAWFNDAMKRLAAGSLTVVTSDTDLARRVRELGARVRSSASFRRHLDQTLA